LHTRDGMNQRTHTRSPLLGLFLALLAACGGDSAGPGDLTDTNPDGDIGPTPISCQPEPFAWPTGEAPTLTPHESWSERLGFGWSTFAVESGGNAIWVKFTILLDGEPRIAFQNGSAYAFHSDFARERLDPFVGMSREQFDAVSLHRDGQRALLGVVLMPSWTGEQEIGVQLVGADPYPAEMVAAAIDLVLGAIDADEPLEAFYVPTGEQGRVTSACAERFAELGVTVSSTERWGGGAGCYSQGWAVGRLVEVPGAEVAAAFEAGTLRSDDILLTRDVPAELPPVAGILTTTPASASSHVAILASTYGAPYALLPREEDVAAARALVGQTVALTAADSPITGASCAPRLVSVDHLEVAQLDSIRAVGDPGELALTAKETRGALVVDVDGLTPGDIRYVGGKAANYGVLRATIADNVRPAKALTFDLWDSFLARPYQGGTLGDFIDARLAGYGWPVDVAALADDLRDIRGVIEDEATFADADRAAVEAALADFDAERRLRFRSSTNVEDSDAFTGAGLYDSKSGCLADDTDGDDTGPSRCDPGEATERGIWRAIKKVYASFYNLNATLERLRHGVDPADVGMAVLVHHSFPDERELANGVALVYWDEESGTPPYLVSSQVGALSVANPDPGVLPEVTRVRNAAQISSVRVMQPSSELPLGARVLADDAEYLALADLFEAVRLALVSLFPGEPLRLDYEYKKVADEGLVVKQVRRVPASSREPTVTPFLVDDGPLRRCTFQGEYADVFANHRLKARWTFAVEDRWLDESGLATRFYDEVSFETVIAGEVVTRSSDDWSEPSHALGDGWGELYVQTVDGGGLVGFGGTLALATQLVTLHTEDEGPIQPLSGLEWFARAEWDEPQLSVIWGDEGQEIVRQATSDEVRLTECPDDVPVDSSELLQTRSFVGAGANAGVSVTTEYYWPPAPTGATGGYTAPLRRWKSTTITGLTSAPLELTGWFAQTYRPEHHNFSEHFLFEPRLDPGIGEAAADELEALGVVYIYATGTPWSSGDATVVLLDGDGGEVTLE